MLLLGCLSSWMSCRYDTRPTDNVLFICLFWQLTVRKQLCLDERKSHRFKQPLTQMQRAFSLPSAWHRYVVFISTTVFFFIHGNKSCESKPRLIPMFHLFIRLPWYLLPETPESVTSFFPLMEMCLLIWMCACVLTYMSLTSHALVHVSRRNAVCHACLMALSFTLSRMSTNYTTANLLTCLPAQQIKLLVPHFNQSHPQDLWCAPVKEAERCHVIRKTPLTEDLATRNWFPGVT